MGRDQTGMMTTIYFIYFMFMANRIDAKTLSSASFERLTGNAIEFLEQGAYERAWTVLEEYDSADPLADDFQISEILFLRATSKHGIGDIEYAMDLYRQALDVRSDMPGAWKNLAILAKEAGRMDVAENAYRRALRLVPDSATSLNSLGFILNRSERYEEAISYFKEALRYVEFADDIPVPEELYADVNFNLGVASMHTGRVQDAIAAYRETIRYDHVHAGSYINLASIYHKSGQIDQAIELYRNAIVAASTSNDSTWVRSGLVEMSSMNLGVALSHRGRSAAALEAFKTSRRSRRNRLRAGLVADYDDNFDDFEISLLAHEVRTRRTVCDWRRDRTDLRMLYREVLKGLRYDYAPALLPFDTLILPLSPAYQRAVAIGWSSQYLRFPQLTLPSASQNRRGRIRIGFLSYDFNDHPTAHMIEGIFKEETTSLGRPRAHPTDLVAISFGKDDDSVFRREIRDACDGTDEISKRLRVSFPNHERPCSGFLNIATLSHEDGAHAIADANIDVLLDLQAHTLGGRQEILARRPAQIQISFLVYPGTMGSPWIDYLVADRFVAPPELQAHYTEALIYFPDSYQINFYPRRDLPLHLRSDDDSDRHVANRFTADTLLRNEMWIQRFKALPPSLVLDDGSLPRSAHGLPPGTEETANPRVVFCNFNKIKKFDRASFGLWMSIMKRVPNSVLWLLEPSTRLEVDTVKYNLENEAQAMGVRPTRIFWAARVPKMAHLSRHKHGTLFLDTLVYNAHSTASDALRGGLPVITCPKGPFAGRVAAALLRAVEIPDLIVSTVKEYEELAVHLARNPHIVEAFRRRLLTKGSRMPLFDSSRYRRHFERAMTAVWDLRRYEGKSSGDANFGPTKPHLIVAPETSGVTTVGVP